MQMLASYDAATTEGTKRNRARQADVYIRFCLAHGLDYFNPSVFTISLFAQYLANSFKAPATWRNYISGAKTWLQAQGGETAAFTSAAFQAVVRGAARSSNHVPHQAPPISPDDVKIICDYLDDQGKSGVVIRSAILLLYFTFLRQSNVLTTSAEPWGGAHTLSRSDVVLGRQGAYVTVRSSKTTSRQEPPRTLFIPKMSSSRYCPLQACTQCSHCPRAVTRGRVHTAMRCPTICSGNTRRGQVGHESRWAQ